MSVADLEAVALHPCCDCWVCLIFDECVLEFVEALCVGVVLVYLVDDGEECFDCWCGAFGVDEFGFLPGFDVVFELSLEGFAGVPASVVGAAEWGEVGGEGALLAGGLSAPPAFVVFALFAEGDEVGVFFLGHVVRLSQCKALTSALTV